MRILKMKLKSLIFSIVVLHVLALGLAWIVMESPEPENVHVNSADFNEGAHVVSLPSTNLAYPALALFGKSYLKGEHPDLMRDINMDSIYNSGWNPAFYHSYQRIYTDVYSLQGLSVWKP